MASGVEPGAASSARRLWLRGGLWSWAQIAVGAVVGILQARLAVTALEPSASGLWFILLSFMGLVFLMDLGLSATLARELAFGEDRERRSKLLATAERLLRYAALATLFVIGPAGALYLHSVTPAALWEGTLWAWGVFVLGAALTLHANAASGVLYGTGFLALDRQIRIVAQVLGLLLAYALLRLEPSLLGLCLAWLGQSLLLWLLEWGGVRRFVAFVRAGFDKALALRLLGLGLRWWVMSVGAYLILSTDNLVIAGTLGAAQVSDYALLARMSAILQPMALAFVTSSAPLVSRLSAEGRTERMQTVLLEQVRLALLFVLLAGAVLSAVPDEVLELWVGPGHFVGYSIVLVFIVMLTLEVHHVAHATLVTATGRLPFALWAVGSGVLNLVFSLILVRHLGLLGVALGTMLAQLLTNNWFAPLYTLRAFGVRISQYLREVFLPMLLLGGALYALARGVRAGTEGFGPLVSVLSVAALTALAALLAFALWLRPARGRVNEPL